MREGNSNAMCLTRRPVGILMSFARGYGGGCGKALVHLRMKGEQPPGPDHYALTRRQRTYSGAP
jgi:hypothetical protein